MDGGMHEWWLRGTLDQGSGNLACNPSSAKPETYPLPTGEHLFPLNSMPSSQNPDLDPESEKHGSRTLSTPAALLCGVRGAVMRQD